MSIRVREWLPLDIAEHGAIRELLGEVAEHWMADWVIATTWVPRWRRGDALPRRDLDHEVLHRSQAGIVVARPANSHARLAMAALDLPGDWHVADRSERELIAEFERRMIADLAAAFDRACANIPIPEAAATNAPALALHLVDTAGNDVLSIGLPHDLLILLAKQRMKRPPKRSSTIAVSRACATEPATVTISLGRAQLRLSELLGLSVGDVVILDRAATAPVDLCIGDRPVLRGNIVDGEGPTTTIELLN